MIYTCISLTRTIAVNYSVRQTVTNKLRSKIHAFYCAFNDW